MRCKEAQAKSSAYLDGDLTDEQSSAVRGHLRQCTACEERFEEESTILELASNLEPLDPPDRVWQGISQKIAEAEIADSEQKPSWRWLAARSRWIGGGALACAAAALLWFQLGPDGTKELLVSAGEAPIERGSDVGDSTVAEATEFALVEADKDYLRTIEELRTMLDEDRGSWSAAVTTAVDAKLASFRRAAIEQRLAPTDSSVVIASRDPVYATYRAEISFLQSALAGDLPSDPGLR